MATNTHCIDAIVDDFYISRGMTGTMVIVRRVVVKHAMKNPSSELAMNNVWVREDIAAIAAKQKAKRRSNVIGDTMK